MIRFRYDPGIVQGYFRLPVKLSADDALTPTAKETDLFYTESLTTRFWLPDHLDRELDFPRFRCCRGFQHACRAVVGRIQRRSRAIENIGIVRRHRKRKIGMVQNIENFGSELYIEGFRNLPNVIVLEK